MFVKIYLPHIYMFSWFLSLMNKIYPYSYLTWLIQLRPVRIFEVLVLSV